MIIIDIRAGLFCKVRTEIENMITFMKCFLYCAYTSTYAKYDYVEYKFHFHDDIRMM